MSTLFITILITFIFMGVSLAVLAIGLIFKGKSILKPGACGRDPNKAKDNSCENTCSLCENEKKDKNDKIHEK